MKLTGYRLLRFLIGGKAWRSGRATRDCGSAVRRSTGRAGGTEEEAQVQVLCHPVVGWLASGEGGC